MDSHFHRSFSCSLSLAPVRCTCPSPDPPCPHRPPAIMATQAHLLLLKYMSDVVIWLPPLVEASLMPTSCPRSLPKSSSLTWSAFYLVSTSRAIYLPFLVFYSFYFLITPTMSPISLSLLEIRRLWYSVVYIHHIQLAPLTWTDKKKAEIFRLHLSILGYAKSGQNSRSSWFNLKFMKLAFPEVILSQFGGNSCRLRSLITSN